MIDFIKAYLHDPVIASRLRSTICSLVEVDVTTGDIPKDVYFGRYKQFKIWVYPSHRIHLEGSLHKFYTGGINSSDFSIDQVIEAVNNISKELGMKSRNIILENFEFAVNIQLPYSPSVVLENIISLPCGELFPTMRPGNGLSCRLGEYKHKIYDKSLQCFLGGSLLRYEIHVYKMRWIFPVKTLHDLTLIENWKLFHDRLKKCFLQIIFTDQYDLKLLSVWELKDLNANTDKYNNSRFWKDLQPLNRFRCLKRLKKIQKAGQYRFGENISELIDAKAEELKTMKQIHPSNTG